jgi:cellobiose phosphorylase
VGRPRVADAPLIGPIRGELLGAEHLAERARKIGRSQRLLAPRRIPRDTPLLARLESSRQILRDAHDRLVRAATDEIDVGPAGEWLLDNFHVVQEHAREVNESLPRGYYRELPELAGGALAGYPRVYELAIALISHSEGRIDLPNVAAFISAYQEEVRLSLGELWALPAMLRLGLIENVRRMALRTVERLDEVELALGWASRFEAATRAGGASIGAALNEFVSHPPPLTPNFVSHFLQRLRQLPGSFTPLLWLEEWLAEDGVSAEDAAARSTQRLAITQVIMANSITSLRTIGRMDWRTFVEQLSATEAVLREDPSGHYSSMTFAARDAYRHVVEQIARRTRMSEVSVAEHAVALASAQQDSSVGDTRRRHVGYYLIDEGRLRLERETGYRPPFSEQIHRWTMRHPNVVFVGGILAAMIVALGAALWIAGTGARGTWAAVILIALLPALDIAVNVVNQLLTAVLPPRRIPKLEFREGRAIPDELRTVVVVPTLFASVDSVREALEHIEVQYLANRDRNLHFAVLSDLTDADSERMPEDEEIISAAVGGVKALNERYAPGTRDAFFLFHRPRRWNDRQETWMGWERKRGKLAQFNAFILRGTSEPFSAIAGDPSAIRGARYVITLDSDTVLPPDAAALLIGAMAHPLNRAVYDPARGRVLAGYGILQPRVGVTLPSANRSHFASINSGHPGVDPYTSAVSDVYQDLYGEGSYTGKGIYDVEVFERATEGRFPENTLLSHDLIEGNFARAGLATDIVVYDDYPTRYLTYTRRKHRWIRGDWQLLRWITGTVPGPAGPERNRLSILARWKLFDNLRRSLVEISQLLLFVAGWTFLPGSPIRWTLLAVGAIVAPWVVSLLIAAVRPPGDKSWRAYYAAVAHDARTSLAQTGLTITVLPHQAWISADAVIRTLWRLGVSRKQLLQWQTSSSTERQTGASAASVWKEMRQSAALTILIAVLVAARAWSTADWLPLAIAAPFLLLWLAAPSITHALSAPAVRRERRLPPARRADALRYALLHWRYFDRFVNEDTNWLAPDNFQQKPHPIVAMRTSPTNVGLQLLATVSAYDLGFISPARLASRLTSAFKSLDRMRRFRGHFYNWYDLRDLSVLEPAYVSTVDSGNLAGHLLALRQACLEILNAPAFDSRIWRALDTALGVAHWHLRSSSASGEAEDSKAWRAIRSGITSVMDARRECRAGERGTPPTTVLAAVEAPMERARAILAESGDAGADAALWLEWSIDRLTQAREWLGELGWEALASAADGAHAMRIPSLNELAARSSAAALVADQLREIASRSYDLAVEMDFRCLYDPERRLFSIGYEQVSHSRDSSFYDLLASEARVASYIAVAKSDVPVEHWLRLGRTLTHASGHTALVSWSGSVFEYLMPVLVMRSYPFTLLDQTYQGAVDRHISYGAERNVPWGISESAYNLRDRHLTYQYRAFGVPDLALQRGLGRNLVVAPYATALAALIDPIRAMSNLAALEELGALGSYGFRDALDFTRPDPGSRFALVETYMAHHVGMGMVALANVLNDRIWQRRFHSEPMVRAAELLLYERIPRRLVMQEAQQAPAEESLPDPALEHPAVREIDTPHTAQPHVALLGQAPYTIMVSNAGGGYSRYGALAVTRWRADGTRDNTGQFCYIKDIAPGRAWSVAHQPVCAPAQSYLALLATDRASFVRSDGDIETRTEIAVVPQDAAEVRRVTLTNNGSSARELEVTSYGEIVLAPPEADRAHPAFANLFVETEWHGWCTALTATRRPRSSTERALWCVHVVAPSSAVVGDVSCETDRMRFIGRGRTTRDPIALVNDGALSGSTGAVLDPIFALRVRVRLQPGESTSVAFTTLVATGREQAFELAGRYHDGHAAQRALDLAWTSAQVELRELGISPAEAAVFQELATWLFYSNPDVRAGQEVQLANRAAQPQLWALGISGDWPIILAMIGNSAGLPTLRQLLAAHHYWRRHGMMVDLVLLNTHPPSYQQELNDKITNAVITSSEAGVLDKPGGVFVRRADIMSEGDATLLKALARVHIDCDGRTLAGIVGDSSLAPEEETVPGDEPPPRSAGQITPRNVGALTLIRDRLNLFRDEPRSTDAGVKPAPATLEERRPAPPAGALGEAHGLGGMTQAGDYEIHVCGDHLPPAPWINVIANPRAGVLVSERGAECTWSENSFFYRLTPWHNDPVSDPPGDAIYLRDEDDGQCWSATPAPLGGDERYVVTHGTGSSTFLHERSQIRCELTLGVPPADPVRLSLLKITNNGSRARRLQITSYAEWTLGSLREHTQHLVQTEYDAGLRAILARNYYDPVFAHLVAFSAASEPPASYTADRMEFLGRNGGMDAPAALAQPALGGSTGAGMDPCAALRMSISLAPGESREIAMVLGAADDIDTARELIDRFSNARRAREALEANVNAWHQRLSLITVRTPEPEFDAIVNRWALYQALGCRMWARTAHYQSSGAYGFRDQLQDSMAFVYAEPAIAREHLLRSASRQFVEGDVQHWWHPQSGRGVRTRFSDDLAWLPYVADHYVRTTGDKGVLDEVIPFLTQPPLAPDVHEAYEKPDVSEESASLYEHCVRALRRACTTGSHGLPLMRDGDWNDGMNRVGVEGKGESVWLAWFLIATTRAFAEHAEARGDADTASQLRSIANDYAKAAEAHAWDGEWYRRAYFDDGTPLGSKESDECNIDSIAQSWSVISGGAAADPSRQAQAMKSLEQHLVREDARLIMLLTPPFDKTTHDPGYIKGYLPGVRENGAQYTHAALWAVLATALRGDGDRAFELFQMLNPLTHARTKEDASRYKVEPYVVAADVYTAEGHLGRGGWTWYTGSAAWTYRVALEALLGFTKRGDTLVIDPCVPAHWPSYTIEYRFGSAVYVIDVQEPGATSRGGAAITVDGNQLAAPAIPLVDDGARHEVVVRPAAAPASREVS